MTPSPPAASGWTILVPVKQTRYAKTRLTGFDAASRRDLAIAFALDTVGAAMACPEVESVVVVTNDPAADRFPALGAIVVPDQPDAGLNPALVFAGQQARKRRADCAVAAISSDLPALRAGDLSHAIAVAPDTAGWFVADAQGVGTTMLAAPAGARWQPQFGPHSRAAHRADGYAEILAAGLERLRRDVDTPVDLWDATRLGVGAATQAALAGVSAHH
jgi:2-phospho-L-lactate guanylyltransferase